MGAQASAANGEDAVAIRQDSRGSPTWSSVKEMEATGRALIAQLEADLAESQNRFEEKAEELAQTQRLLAKLEGAIEKQAQDSQHEQDRISRMEANLAQQQQGTEEKVGKLILAVAGEKHRAELAEKARDAALEQLATAQGAGADQAAQQAAEQAAQQAAEQAAAEWQATVQELRDQLAKEESLRESAEERAKEMEQRLLNLSDLNGKLLQMPEVEQELASEKALRREADCKVAELEAKLAALEQDLDTWGPRADSGELNQMVRDLQQQVAGEMSKRMDVQNKLLEKERSLREAQEELSKTAAQVATVGDHTHPAPDEARKMLIQVSDRLNEKEKKLLEVEGKLVEKDYEIQKLNQQLGDELKQRTEAMKMVAEKEHKISDLQLAMSGDGLSRQQALQGQVIEKEREVCELQQQLADELSKRQAVQYQVIEKERLVCSLQQQLMGIGHMVEDHALANRLLELPTHQEDDLREDYEPDDEPRIDGVGSSLGGSSSFTPAQTSRLAWGSPVQQAWQQPMSTPSTVFRRTSTGQDTGSAGRSPQPQQPPHSGTNTRRSSIEARGATFNATPSGAAWRSGRYFAQPGTFVRPTPTGAVRSSQSPTWPTTEERNTSSQQTRRLILSSRTFT